MLGYFEIILFSKCVEKFGNNNAEIIFNNFFRYIDDILILWHFSHQMFLDFIVLLKEVYTHLEITVNTNLENINFLDVSISVSDDKYVTDIYRKPTDNFSYVPFDSYHPGHIKRNIPYNLFRRISLIVSNPTIKLKRMNEVKNELLKLKYPITLINDAINKSFNSNLTNKSKNNDALITFQIKHNHQNFPIINNVKNCFKMLKTCSQTESIFKNHKLIVSYNNNSNILQNFNKSFPIVKKCNINRCGTCSLLITGRKLEFNNICFFSNTVINCRSKNLIYFLKCFNCNQFYIGETECEFRYRVTLHRQHGRTNYGNSKLANHLKVCCDKSPNLFRLFPFYQNSKMTKKSRKLLEEYFIKKYNPPLNGNQ